MRGLYRVVAYSVLGISFVVCSRAGSSTSEYQRNREQARQVVQVQCGACHNPHTPTANSNALKVFDLSEENWAGHMTARQRTIAAKRLQQRRTMTANEIKAMTPTGVPQPPIPSSAEVFTVEEFLLGQQVLR